MIEIKFSRFPRWDEIKELEKKAKNNIIIVKLPKSIYNSSKMKYKLEYMRRKLIFVEVDEQKRGRPKKIDESIKNYVVQLLTNGKNLSEIARELNIPRTTIFDNIKDFLPKIKREKFMKLLYEYKEFLIEKELYAPHVQILFSELEMHIKKEDFENAKKILDEIIKISKSARKNKK
ncbi:helix-turn-helix domain-containing protein [Methanotorris formicicus]|uniref:Resolvase domain-containing protein n=1 Tax=Methanotorris formicicus Mc-S-70 TaxID=647171 RepID=H1L1J6_9EURY|nr:helix-turn-helix domain-containing protein [Methanotorris formicicus]EHP83666.1 resolvase domain-containing protein [Methanotorris formicicus Mc-S-70]